jgi:hypothetical protein
MRNACSYEIGRADINSIKKWRWYVFSIFAILVAYWFVSESESFVKCISADQHHYANQSPRGCLALLYVGITSRIGCSWGMLDRNHDAIIALFTIVIGTFTFLLFTDARDKGRKELRAYISGVPDFVHGFSSTVTQMSLTVVNHGYTPAHKVITTGIIDILPYPLPGKFPFLEPTIPVSNGTTIHPKAPIKVYFSADRKFSTQEMNDAVGNSGKRLYLFGTIYYNDIFGNEQRTDFCRSVVGSNNLSTIINSPTTQVDLGFEIATQHNDAT